MHGCPHLVLYKGFVTYHGLCTVRKDHQIQTRAVNVDESQLRDKHFACTGCGICCTGSGNVWCSRGELDAILKHHGGGMTFEEYVQEHCDVDAMRKRQVDSSEWFILKNAPGTDHCIFLNPENNHCKIYGTRPLQCSTYPWWPELVGSNKAWEHEAYAVCEGIVVMDNSIDAVERLDVIRNVGAEFHTMEEKIEKLDAFCTYLEDFPY